MPRGAAAPSGRVLVAEDGRRLDPVDEVIVLTGFRPDPTFLDELRPGLDERLQTPVAPAPLMHSVSIGSRAFRGDRPNRRRRSGKARVGSRPA